MSSRKIIKKVRRPEKLVEIVEMKPKKRAQRQPKKQGRQRKTVRNTRSMVQRVPGIDRFPRGNRQGTGFGTRKRIVITESEFIAEVTVANQPNFNVALNLSVNPGQAATFPWLSTIAKQYEKYCFRSLQFVYKPEVTQYNPTSSALGKVMLSADYDASDSPPTSKQNVEDTDPHADGMPYEKISFFLDPAELHKNSDAKFVRPGAQPLNTDIRIFDCANLYVSNQGQTGNGVNLGELHVIYTVELSVPILEGSSSASTNRSVSWFQSTTAESAGATTVAKNLAFATASINNNAAVNTAGSFVLPAGNYLVDVSAFAANSTGVEFTMSLDFKVGGVSQFSVVPSVGGGTLATTDPGGEISFSVYFVSTGANAVIFPATFTYSSGTQTVWGNVRFTSV
jgi:hypothetical protein